MSTTRPSSSIHIHVGEVNLRCSKLPALQLQADKAWCLIATCHSGSQSNTLNNGFEVPCLLKMEDTAAELSFFWGQYIQCWLFYLVDKKRQQLDMGHSESASQQMSKERCSLTPFRGRALSLNLPHAWQFHLTCNWASSGIVAAASALARPGH